MLQGGQVQGQVQTTQAQWRQQQLEMHKQKQQQIIHQHVQTLTIEQRQQFAAMSAMEKQQYLAQRNLLLPNPSANWGQQVQLQRHTIQVSWSVGLWGLWERVASMHGKNLLQLLSPDPSVPVCYLYL